MSELDFDHFDMRKGKRGNRAGTDLSPEFGAPLQAKQSDKL